MRLPQSLYLARPVVEDGQAVLAVWLSPLVFDWLYQQACHRRRRYRPCPRGGLA